MTAAQFTSPSSSLSSVFAAAVCDCLKPMPDCLAGFKINAVNNVNRRRSKRLLRGDEVEEQQQQEEEEEKQEEEENNEGTRQLLTALIQVSYQISYSVSIDSSGMPVFIESYQPQLLKAVSSGKLLSIAQAQAVGADALVWSKAQLPLPVLSPVTSKLYMRHNTKFPTPAPTPAPTRLEQSTRNIIELSAALAAVLLLGIIWTVYRRQRAKFLGIKPEATVLPESVAVDVYSASKAKERSRRRVLLRVAPSPDQAGDKDDPLHKPRLEQLSGSDEGDINYDTDESDEEDYEDDYYNVEIRRPEPASSKSSRAALGGASAVRLALQARRQENLERQQRLRAIKAHTRVIVGQTMGTLSRANVRERALIEETDLSSSDEDADEHDLDAFHVVRRLRRESGKRDLLKDLGHVLLHAEREKEKEREEEEEIEEEGSPPET